MNYKIGTGYKFINIPENEILSIQQKVKQLCIDMQIFGTILLAPEGINFTISGINEKIIQFMIALQSIKYFNNLEYNSLTQSFFIPFKKMKVRCKKEIVALKDKNLNILQEKPGQYLNSQEWDTLISSQDVIIIDTRNNFEYAYGTFENAINPNIQSFSELPQWLQDNLDLQNKKQKIAMFCTGGIRCEKSTAYLTSLGCENVYQLKGGVIQYFIDNHGKKSLWNGNLFIFDDRIALDKNLNPINEN
jgi:UPF0176 protein